jgi:drug/metabolite transporter (DMT)-like permease
MIITPDTLLIRLIGLDTWSALFYRSLFPSVALFIGYIILYRGRTINDFYDMGTPGVINALFILFSNITFIFAVANTNVANALIMISLIPLAAALFSAIFLNERPLLLTWLCMIACLITIIFIFYESYEMGRFLGDFFGLLCAMSMGASLTVMRRYNYINFVPSYIFAKFLTAVVALPFATTFVIGGFDLLFSLLMIITVGVSFLFITIAPKYITSPEVGIFFLLETAFGPLWVWFFISEEPTRNTLIGGSIIVLIIFIHSLIMIRKEKNRDDVQLSKH